MGARSLAVCVLGICLFGCQGSGVTGEYVGYVAPTVELPQNAPLRLPAVKRVKVSLSLYIDNTFTEDGTINNATRSVCGKWSMDAAGHVKLTPDAIYRLDGASVDPPPSMDLEVKPDGSLVQRGTDFFAHPYSMGNWTTVFRKFKRAARPG